MMSSIIRDLNNLIAVIVGLIVLIVVLIFTQPVLQISAWITTLNIPDNVKIWLLENTFAFILFLIGIPALIMTKIRRIW